MTRKELKNWMGLAVKFDSIIENQKAEIEHLRTENEALRAALKAVLVNETYWTKGDYLKESQIAKE